MSNLIDKDESDEVEFFWGAKRGRGGQNKEVQFYESFTYDGVEYFLYDSVFLFKEGEAEPYVGKIIKIWQHSNKSRKVKVLWFFYPWEISTYISDENVLENELFLATGDGKGLANVNPLEAIAGKCNVVCISKDERNRQPSIDEIKMAQYVFYRTFDVNTHAISDKLGEKIATIEVNFLLNKNVFKSLDSPTVDSDDVVVVLDASIDSQMVKDDKAAKSLSKKENCHPLENVSAAGPDITGPVVGLEEKLITEGPGGVNETVEYDGCVGSILVKEDKVSKGKDDAAGPSNLGSLVLPAAEVTMVSSKKIRSSSPDSKKNDVNEKGVVLPLDNRVTHKSKLGSSAHSLGQNAMNGPDSLEDSVPPLSFVDDKRSKLVNDNIKAVDAVAKANSDDNQLKKRKIAVTAPLCDNGGTSTPKRATVMSKTASKSVGTATEFNDISDGLSKKLKTDSLAGEKSNDKLREMSVKMSEDKKGSAAVSVAAIKPTQLARDDAEIGTSNGLSKKLKYNIKIENKSNDKNIKLEHKFNDKNVKVEQKFNGKNIKMEHKSNDELYKVLKEESKDAEIGARGHVTEVTQRPRDRSKWFTASPWEDRMKEARDQGRLVLLQNLDPTYASSEVEDIVWHGFKESCTAKMLQHTETSNQHSGQALVICKTKDAAEKIVMMLERNCLMLPNGRPVIGRREVACSPGKRVPFPGHLVIDKLRHQLQRESREAVSTSHSSQPNTIEYEMALEWRLLQDRSELWWKLMHKRQGEEIKN